MLQSLALWKRASTMTYAIAVVCIPAYAYSVYQKAFGFKFYCWG